MRKCFDLRFVLAIGLTALSTAAFAGAWTLNTGQGVAIVTASASQSDKAFDGKSSLQSIPRYSKGELQALLQYGASDWLTLIFSPSMQHVAIGGPFDVQRTGSGYTDVGGRMRLLEGNSWVVSAQTTFRIPGTFDKSNLAAIGYTEPEVDIRGLVGYSFAAGAWPAFVDIQVGQRFRLGGPPNELRADVTFGLEPHDRWLLLMQSFNVMSEGAGSWGYPSYSYSKLQLSAVFALTPALSFQLGGYTTYSGRNALQENGLMLGSWFKF
jgi:hypothetical protein